MPMQGTAVGISFMIGVLGLLAGARPGWQPFRTRVSQVFARTPGKKMPHDLDGDVARRGNFGVISRRRQGKRPVFEAKANGWRGCRRIGCGDARKDPRAPYGARCTCYHTESYWL
jgi:hypothetical protein